MKSVWHARFPTNAIDEDCIAAPYCKELICGQI